MNDSNVSEKREKIHFRVIDVLLAAVCLIAAVVLWYYVADSDVSLYDVTFSNVGIEIRNSSGLSVLTGADATVDVTVSGKRKVVNNLGKPDVSAYIVIPEDVTSGKNRFRVEIEAPNGVSGCRASSEYVTLYLDNTITASVPVTVKVVDYMIEDGFELNLDGIKTDYETVSVTGPAAVVETVSAAYVEVPLGRVMKSVTINKAFTLVTTTGETVESNYIKTGVSSVTASIPVYKYRDVPVEVVFKNGIFSEANCEVTASPAFIRVKGDAESVDDVKIVYEIDEKTITGSSAEFTKAVQLPADITNVSGETEVVITVSATGITTKEIEISSLHLLNPGGIAAEMATKQITVKVRGDVSVMDGLQARYIYAEADISKFSGSEGLVSVPLRLRFLSPYDSNVYDVGEYSVSVMIGETAEGY